jgi:hypothetical protein
MAGSLAPAPRIQVVIVDGNEVLVIGVARAPALVPCIENGELKYYLRIGDATLAIAPYLISDLVLGRRIHPQLLVTTEKNGFGAVNGSAIHFGFVIENESMVPANDVILGVVSLSPHTTAPNQGRIASHAIRNYVDVAENNCDKGVNEPLDLIHITSRGKPPTMVNLPAFESISIGGIGYLIVPDHSAPIPMRSALYVLASGHPPEWYQFDWVLPDTDISTLTISSLTRTYTERPMVAWNQEWRQP